MKILQWLFVVYTTTLFLLHGLSPVPFLSFGFFVAVGALAVACSMPSILSQLRFRRDDPLFGLIYLLGLVPWFLNPNGIGEQHLEYGALWLAIALICFWWVREWALTSQLSFMAISRAAAIGAALLSISVTAEFVMVNTTGLYLSDIFPFSLDEFTFATILGSEFIRPRGFSAEPGFSAIVFNCLIPLSVAHLLAVRRHLLIWAGVIFPGYILLGSAASLACLAITTSVFLLVINRSLIVMLTSAAAVSVAGIAFVMSNALQSLYYQIIGRKIDALFDPMNDYATSYTRSEAYRYGFRILREHPFGLGWGGFSEAHRSARVLVNEIPKGSGLLSVPLEIGVAGGIFAVVLFFYLIWRKLHPLIRIDTLPARLTFFSLLWVSLHHMFVLELWFPMLWFSLALADVVRIRAATDRLSRLPDAVLSVSPGGDRDRPIPAGPGGRGGPSD